MVIMMMRTTMRRLGLNQAQLSRELNYTPSRVCRILKGEIEPTQAMCDRLYTLIQGGVKWQ